MLPRISQIRLPKQTAGRALVFATAVFLVALVFLPAYSVMAQEVQAGQADTFGVAPVAAGIDLATGDVRVIMGRIIRAVLGLLGIILVSIIVYAGYIIMTAGANAEQITKGKKWIVNATIGLAIVLSAFSIVQFFLNAFNRAILGDRGARAPRVRVDSFVGSGALGRIIYDHYPERGQTEVPRNARVVITFREPIDPASIIEERNNTAVLGDCVTPPEGEVFSWETHCDRLIPGAMRIFLSTSTPLASLPDDAFVAAAALANYDADGHATTFTLRPYSALGNAIEPVWYSVNVSNNIRVLETGEGIFEGRRDAYYEWEFQTGTLLDESPPEVASVYPSEGGEVARNTILQIQFNEPMDPTTAAGVLRDGGNFINIIFHGRAEPLSGEWRISNGYRTLEFVSDRACGLNSCGEPMYCLPVANCDNANNPDCSESYEVMARTADLINQDSWEALPMSGIADMAGNALDGNRDQVRDDKPPLQGDFELDRAIRAQERLADNFIGYEAADGAGWNFTVENVIDRSSPRVYEIYPPVDAENVSEDERLLITFSKTMWSATLSGLGLEEYPEVADLGAIWFLPRAEFVPDVLEGVTRVELKHRQFGPDDAALYYFPSVGSEVKSINQNCLYPGFGPAAERGASMCAPDGRGCVGADLNAQSDTGCATGDADIIDPTAANIEQCLQNIRAQSPEL